jgi:chemotaxis protein CheC
MSDSPATGQPELTQDQKDVLQEVANIGMGQAGDSLARILGTFVHLSIPRIRLIGADKLKPTLIELVGNDEPVTGVRQAFFSHWHGEIITIFGQAGCKELAMLMNYPKDMSEEEETELFLDVGNVLAGACMNGLAETLGVELNFSPPSILMENTPVEDLFSMGHITWSNTLLVEVNFKLENFKFTAHLLMMLTEESIENLRADLDKFFENL